jgi:hypothetical protein
MHTLKPVDSYSICLLGHTSGHSMKFLLGLSPDFYYTMSRINMKWK